MYCLRFSLTKYLFSWTAIGALFYGKLAADSKLRFTSALPIDLSDVTITNSVVVFRDGGLSLSTLVIPCVL